MPSPLPPSRRPPASAPWALAALVALAAAASPGCALDEEQERVAAALLETVEALDRGDSKALWAISAPGAQRELLNLHDRLSRALDAVDSLYPPDQRAEARAALGEQLLAGLDPAAGDDQLGPALLDRLLDPQAMRLDDRARDGLRARGAVVEGDKATIHTAAGELFTFERVDGAWRSRLIADLLEQSPAVDRLRANADAVLQAQEAAREAWRESRDPRTPNGAYNALRAAVAHAPPDGAVLYTLVDDAARDVLVQSLEVARKAQRAIQRKTKRARRAKRYEEHGLRLFVDAASDRALLEAWALTDDFEPPVRPDDPPAQVLPAGAEGGAARSGGERGAAPAEARRRTLVTAAGRRLSMRRDDAGTWRLEGYDAVLREHLLARARRALEAVSPPAKGATEEVKGSAARP